MRYRRWKVHKKSMLKSSIYKKTSNDGGFVHICTGDKEVANEIRQILDIDSDLFLNAIYIRQGEIAELVDKAPADGMTGQTDEDNMGVTYEQIDAFLLEDILPDVNTWRNMSQRHERNEHKKCINLPGPFAHGRHYEKGKHGGVFEVF